MEVVEEKVAESSVEEIEARKKKQIEAKVHATNYVCVLLSGITFVVTGDAAVDAGSSLVLIVTLVCW